MNIYSTDFGFREGYDHNDRVIGQDTVNFEGKEYFVSTVDLGLDHSFDGGEPLYWETMVFLSGDPTDLYCDRYPSKELAVAGHNKVVKAFNEGTIKLSEGYFELID